MKKSNYFAIFLAGTMALASCQTLETASDTSGSRSAMTVDMERGPWATFGGHWRQKSDDYEVRFTVRNINGKAGLCGVQFDGTQNLRNLHTRLMRDFGVVVDGQMLVQGFDHFVRVEDVRARGLKGTCKTGSVDWSDEFRDAGKWEIRRRGSGRYRL